MNKKKLKNRKKLILDFISNKEYKPMRVRDIAMLLQIPKGKRAELYEVLDSLEEEGKIRNRKGRYELAEKEEPLKEQQILEGIFIAHPKGFGFVAVEEEAEDIYIHEEDTANAFHQDRVQVQIKPDKKGSRREGKIVGIIGHGITEVIGTFESSQNYGFVVPDNGKITKDLFIPREHTQGAVHGDKVVAKIISYGGKNKSPEGRIREILGAKGQPGVDVLSIARSYELPMEFPEKVKIQADKMPEKVLESDFAGRMDLRDWTVVTIDGEDAKDLDDGISLTKEGSVYHLGVHIADVSNYVQGGSALDREALRRGTSVYLVDRVIPMLPKKLSNGICSLNQGEDRLALSCLMDIDENGKMLSHQIAETVICVDRRMTYTAVKGILEGDKELENSYEDLVPLFYHMRDLSLLLRKKRTKRGSIDFDFPESKIYLDEMGRPVEIRAYEQNVATRIIEDFMLLANETVAKEFCEREIPFLYRTHENPDMDRMEKVLTFIRNQGIAVQKSHEEISPLEIQEILASIEGESSEPLISRLLLRSMKQARYTTGCSGHFGLAAKHYCHFTSPIRRYPDLQIHRIIKDQLRGRMKEEKRLYYAHILEDVAMKTSTLERRAEEVERETIKLKKAEYMESHLEEIFEGVISGVTGWGIYVELPNTIEGLVHVNSLRDDYYRFDEESYCLVGEDTGKSYHLGDPVKVQAAGADVVSKTIDFILIEEPQDSSSGKHVVREKEKRSRKHGKGKGKTADRQQ